MEPMVIFSVALIVYCGYLAVLDAFRDREREQGRVRKPGTVKRERPCPEPARVIFSGRGQGDDAGRHWPGLAKGSA
jgi:hypothetical protein